MVKPLPVPLSRLRVLVLLAALSKARTWLHPFALLLTLNKLWLKTDNLKVSGLLGSIRKRDLLIFKFFEGSYYSTGYRLKHIELFLQELQSKGGRPAL